MSLSKFRQIIRSKALKKELSETLAKYGLQVLEDDGAWIFIDDYTDTVKVHMRELGWSGDNKWKQMSEFYRPVPSD